MYKTTTNNKVTSIYDKAARGLTSRAPSLAASRPLPTWSVYKVLLDAIAHYMVLTHELSEIKLIASQVERIIPDLSRGKNFHNLPSTGREALSSLNWDESLQLRSVLAGVKLYGSKNTQKTTVHKKKEVDGGSNVLGQALLPFPTPLMPIVFSNNLPNLSSILPLFTRRSRVTMALHRFAL